MHWKQITNHKLHIVHCANCYYHLHPSDLASLPELLVCRCGFCIKDLYVTCTYVQDAFVHASNNDDSVAVNV